MNPKHMEAATDDIVERVMQGKSPRGCYDLYDVIAELFSQHENVAWLVQLVRANDVGVDVYDLTDEIERRLRAWLAGKGTGVVLERAEQIEAEEREEA